MGLQINIERTTPPNMPLNDDLVEKMKVVMSSRYNVANQALNLSAFHLDEAFAGESFYAPLWRTNVMNKIVTVIEDNIPELKALDLSSNKLSSQNLEFFSTFKSKIKDLSILYLANNKIQDTKALERLKGLKLTELKMEGNPLIDILKSQYIPSVRKTFPSLEVLDGKPLPKEIGFDDDDTTASSGELPASVAKMV